MMVAPLIFAREASGKGVGRFKVRAFHSHLLPESGRRRIGYPASQHRLAGVFYLGNCGRSYCHEANKERRAAIPASTKPPHIKRSIIGVERLPLKRGERRSRANTTRRL